MAEKGQISKSIKEGFVSGFPIVIGYFPVAMAFGLLARNTGISFGDTSLLSIMVFAGASQFMALDLIRAGASAASIILATFLLNLRHLMMSASLSVRLKDIRKSWLFLIAFGVTDETFSVSSLSNRQLTVPFLLVMQGISYGSWVAGTIIGYLVGNMLPASVQCSLGIGLYAMFMALLMPEIKKSLPILLISIISAVLYAGLSHFKILPSSWSIIAAIIIASAIGAVVVPGDEKELEA